jgi:hypothetical protein
MRMQLYLYQHQSGQRRRGVGKLAVVQDLQHCRDSFAQRTSLRSVSPLLNSPSFTTFQLILAYNKHAATAVCSPSCVNGGRCTSNNVCDCSTARGFTGPTCAIPEQTSPVGGVFTCPRDAICLVGTPGVLSLAPNVSSGSALIVTGVSATTPPGGILSWKPDGSFSYTPVL